MKTHPNASIGKYLSGSFWTRRIVTPLAALAAVAALLSSAQAQAPSPVFTYVWSIGSGTNTPNDLPGSPGTGNNVRGLAISPLTTNVVYASTTGGTNNGNSHFTTLDFTNSGAILGQANGTGIANGTLGLDQARVSDDGFVYVCNLSAAPASEFRIYRWPSDTDFLTAPTIVYDSGSGTSFQWRLGDYMDLRGSGINTEIVFGGNGSGANVTTNFTIFRPTDASATTFTNFSITIPGSATSICGGGITFEGTTNALYMKAASGKPAYRVAYNPTNLTAQITASFQMDQSANNGLKYYSANGVNMIATVCTGTTAVTNGIQHYAKVLQLTDPSNAVVVLNQPLPVPNQVNGNAIGLADFKKGYAVFSEPNNGISLYSLGFVTNLPPSIISQPADQTNVLASGYVTFAVSASGTTPLKYQWYFTDANNLATNKVTWAVSTNASLTMTNLALTNAGFYSVVITNNYGSQTSVLAALGVVPATLTAAFVPTWSKGASDLFFLSANNTERGLAYNPVNGHLIVVSRTPSSGVYVLDAATGSYLHSLDMSAVGTAGTFPVNLVGVADDGAVYVANLDTAGTQYEIYRWADDNAATIATIAYGPADPGLGDRIGDTFAVRGAGANTEILAASRDNATIVLFNSFDGLNYNPTIIDTTPEPAGLAGLGLAWGAGTTFWTKSSGYQYRHITYDLTAGTNGLLQTFAAGQNTDTALGVDPVNNLVVGLVPNTASGVGPRALPDHLDLYDVNDVLNDPTGLTEPTLIDQDIFQTDNVNGNGTGALAFDVAGGRLFALDTNNGLLAGKVVARLFEAKSGSKVVLIWTGPSKLLNSSIVVGPYVTNSIATSPYTNAPAGAEYFRLQR